jgi:PhnB protein
MASPWPKENKMPLQIEPYLSFTGNCEEALDFYAQCLDGKVSFMQRYGGSPMDDGKLPAGWKEKVMHSVFVADGTGFMASDAMPGQPSTGYAGISMSLNVPKDAARAKRIFDALANGGQVQMPFGKTFWADGFGMLTDKFGVPWMVNCQAG